MVSRVATTESLFLVLILSIAVALRIANIESVFITDYDEGVYCETARMIVQGNLPHTQVFSSQPAHFVLIIAGFFKLLGLSVVSARLFIVMASIVGIVSVYLIARRIEDWKAGLVAACVLSVSPFFLELSRKVDSDIPSIGFVLLGVWLFFEGLENRSNGYIGLSGVAVSLGTMMKLNVGLVVVLILTVLIARKNLRGAGVFLAGCMSPLLILPLFDLHKVIDQIVIFHISKPATGTLLGRGATILNVLEMDVGLTVTALFGALVCMIRKELEGRFILVLTASMFAFLLSYRALFIQHAVVVVPLMAIMSGIGLVTPWNRWRREKRHDARNEQASRVSPIIKIDETNTVCALLILSLSLSVFYAVAMVPSGYNDLRTISPADSPLYRDAAATIRTYTNDGDYIISDSQALAFFAERDVPPDLIDTSHMRISSGYLDSESVIRAAEEYRVRVIVLCTGRLERLTAFVHYVRTNFQILRDYDGCQIYGRLVRMSSALSTVGGRASYHMPRNESAILTDGECITRLAVQDHAGRPRTRMPDIYRLRSAPSHSAYAKAC